MPEETIRLNKYISEVGEMSRRAADAAIEAGRICVNGHVATLGQRVTGNENITIDGNVLKSKDAPVIIAFNKPRGIVCTAEKREKDNIIDYINYPSRIYPIGRLDKDSHGLILLTNRGDIVNGITRARYYHEKEYIVSVDKPINDSFIDKMSKGVYLSELDETTRPCVIEQLSKFRFRIILTQGLNRQIRRMCKELGYRVKDLKRVRVMNIELKDLKEGTYRELTKEELAKLDALIFDRS